MFNFEPTSVLSSQTQSTTKEGSGGKIITVCSTMAMQDSTYIVATVII